MVRRIVIIGCGVSGTTAAFYARKTDRTAEITIVGSETLPEYSRCGLPYAFSGVVPNLRSLIGYDEDFYEHTNRIHLRLGLTATKVHSERHLVELDSEDRHGKQLTCDTLIPTTGAHPTNLSVPGSDLRGVFTIRTMNDVEHLADYLREAMAKKVAIIGAGLTGSEMAEALLLRGVAVIQAELVREILPVSLDADMASICREKGQEHGVEYHLQSSLEEILGDKERVVGVRISGRTHDVDAVLVAVRGRPNTDLAKDAGIQRAQRGASRTDARVAASAKNMYA